MTEARACGASSSAACPAASSRCWTGSRTRRTSRRAWRWRRDAGATETVTCYLWDDTTRTAGEWSFQHFRAAHLAAYVEMCEAFREDVQNNDLPPEEEEAGE